MRHHRIAVVAVTTVALVGACTRAGGRQQVGTQMVEVKAPDTKMTRAVVRTDTGIGILTLPDGRMRLQEPAAVAVPNGSGLATIRADGDKTDVVVIDSATGDERAAHPVPAGLAIRAVSRDGRLVALTPAGTHAGDTTRIVITDVWGVEDNHAFTLKGTFEPEAFSVNTGVLYVIEELPAELYRVRGMSTTTGELSDVLGKDKAPIDEDMSGIRGAQALAPNGNTLYTLYLRSTPSGPLSFVHTLDLDGGFAICVDLPPSLTDVAHGGAIAVAPDSSKSYVLGGAPRQLAVVSAGSYEVERVKPLPMLDPATPAVMTALRDGTVVIGAGKQLITLNPELADEPRVHSLQASLSSLQVMPDGTSTLASAGNDLQVLDGQTGAVVSHVSVPGLQAVEAVV